MGQKESEGCEAPRIPPGPHHTGRPGGTATRPAGGHVPAGQGQPSGGADLPLRRVGTRPADNYSLRPIPPCVSIAGETRGGAPSHPAPPSIWQEQQNRPALTAQSHLRLKPSAGARTRREEARGGEGRRRAGPPRGRASRQGEWRGSAEAAGEGSAPAPRGWQRLRTSR